MKQSFFENHLCKGLYSYRKSVLLQKFPVLAENCDGNYLSLWKYIDEEPTKFYSEKAASDLQTLLCLFRDSYPEEFIRLLKERGPLFSLAFKALNEVNALGLHKEELGFKDYETMEFIETNINPAYLKLTEAVYSNLILPISIYSRLKRNVPLDGLNTFNRVDELSKPEQEYLRRPYKCLIRNAIGHGDVHYKSGNVIYRDRDKELILANQEVFELFDDMQDLCNGLALGLHLFYFSNIEFMQQHNIQFPLFMMTEELQAQANAPSWKIKGCLESEIREEKQLNMHTQIGLMDFNTFMHNAFLSATLAARFAPEYEGYFISFSSKFVKGGCVSFNGRKLQNAQDFNECISSIKQGSIIFAPKITLPQFIFKIWRFLLICQTQFKIPWYFWQKTESEVKIKARHVRIHRNGCYSIVQGGVVIESQKLPMDVAVRKYHKSLLYSVVKLAYTRAGCFNISPHLRIGFATVSVYSKDFRVRRLKNLGLVPELICTIELKRLPRIREGNIYGGTPEIIGPFKIVWNTHPMASINRDSDR